MATRCGICATMPTGPPRFPTSPCGGRRRRSPLATSAPTWPAISTSPCLRVAASAHTRVRAETRSTVPSTELHRFSRNGNFVRVDQARQAGRDDAGEAPSMTPASTDPAETPTSERVADVMLARPKTVPATATVGEIRAMFANDRLISALLVDGEAFAGLLDREDLPADAPDSGPARRYARTDVARVNPETPVA